MTVIPLTSLRPFPDATAAVGQGLQVFQKFLAPALRPSGHQFGLQLHGNLAHFQIFPPALRQQGNPIGAAVLLVRRARNPARRRHAFQQRGDGVGIAGQQARQLALRRLRRAPFSSSVRRVVNWSGVTPVWAMRRRKAWFRLNQAWRSRMGRRRREGASIGREPDFDFGLAICGCCNNNTYKYYLQVRRSCGIVAGLQEDHVGRPSRARQSQAVRPGSCL